MSLDKVKAARKQQVGVLLDIGNSETRVRVKYKPLKGLGAEYTPVEMTFALTNHFYGLESSYQISADYMNRATTLLDIGGVRIAHGELVEREFVGSYEFPTGKVDKSAEPITQWSIQLALLETIYRLAEEWGIPASSVDVAFNIYCLVPPEEHQYNREAMSNLIAAIDVIKTLVPQADGSGYLCESHEIICNDIQIYPEGISAFYGIRVNIQNGVKMSVNKDVEKYMKGYALVIDIGAGTTDLAIMQDGILKADSRLSINDAGNHIISALLRNIKTNPKLRGRLMLGIRNVKSVMEEAIINEGDGLLTEDCIDALNAAKEELAASLANQIKTWANSMPIISMVKGILVVGGANIAAYRNGKLVSPAMDTFLIPKIRQFADLAELIPINNRDPRYLNLDGLESIYLSKMSKRSAD